MWRIHIRYRSLHSGFHSLFRNLVSFIAIVFHCLGPKSAKCTFLREITSFLKVMTSYSFFHNHNFQLPHHACISFSSVAILASLKRQQLSQSALISLQLFSSGKKGSSDSFIHLLPGSSNLVILVLPESSNSLWLHLNTESLQRDFFLFFIPLLPPKHRSTLIVIMLLFGFSM